jgi:hypothetical protein
MVSVLDMPVENLLAAVEAEAAAGNIRAERVLRDLLEEEARTGDLGVFARLLAKPHVEGDRHARGGRHGR